jgi:hypothetical protein
VELITGRALILPFYDPDSSVRPAEAMAVVEALRRSSMAS